jgi:hypothetical protein
MCSTNLRYGAFASYHTSKIEPVPFIMMKYRSAPLYDDDVTAKDILDTVYLLVLMSSRPSLEPL